MAQMVYMFSNQEMVDMVLVYGEVEGNADIACRLYSERFPNRVTPPARKFETLVQQLRSTGKLSMRRIHETKDTDTCMNTEDKDPMKIKEEENADENTGSFARNLNGSECLIWRPLQELQNDDYIEDIQILTPKEQTARLQFCQWLLKQISSNENFLSKILVTSEACFTKDGVQSLSSNNDWADKSNGRRGCFVNVWAGIFNGKLIGPVMLRNHMKARDYLSFLKNDLIKLLNEVPASTNEETWFLHDGGLLHHDNHEVREYLNQTYNQRWIGTGASGPVSWVPQSSDINPVDFYVWGYMKHLVYKSEIYVILDLKNRIEEAAETIRLRSLQTCYKSWARRARLCIEAGGGNIEHLL